MRDPEWVDPNDPCRLAPRLPGDQRQVHLEVRAVNGVAEGVEERGVTLERADRLRPLVLVREGERDVVLVLFRIGVPRQVALLDHRDGEQGFEQLLHAVPACPFRRDGCRIHLGLPGLLRMRPRQNVRHRHGVVRSFQGKPAVGGHSQQKARVGERKPDAVGGLENGVETGHRDAGGAEGLLPGATPYHGRAQQAGVHDGRCPSGCVHHGSDGKGQRRESTFTGLPPGGRRSATARDQSR